MSSLAPSPLNAAKAGARPMDVDLVRSLIDEGRFHAALSYFTTRSLPPWRLPELHQMLQSCLQSLLLEGRTLAVELFGDHELALIESIDINDPEWRAFVDWATHDYGTSRLGSIIYPLSFRSDQASAFINTILHQPHSHKDIMGLLCISQISGCAPAELSEAALALASNQNLKILGLRCLSEWVVVMRCEDHELIASLIDRAVQAASNRNDFFAAAYILEKLSAPWQARHQLALNAIEKADVAGLDSPLSDHFHVYLLPYLQRQQLGELMELTSNPTREGNSFHESLRLCLEAWLHIREAEPEQQALPTNFSEYLAALSMGLYPDRSGASQRESDLPVALTDAQLRALASLSLGRSDQPTGVITAALAHLASDTSKLELA
ncbi:MAG: hypothetical protein VKO39_12455 [Cyanobacteriota bacterium]|nr:hypothetical protein [Cyanobacteriota bacterium]